MTNNKNNGLKATVALSLLALVGTLIYTVILYQDKEKTTKSLTAEKELVLKDLTNLKSEYDKSIATNETTSRELEEARDKIAKFIDSVKSMKADITYLFRYKNQVSILKQERTQLIKKVDSLTKYSQILASQMDSTLVELENQSVFRDSLIVQNTQLSNAVKAGATLNITKMSVSGIKERRSGKQIETNRARRMQKLKICFTVAKNVIAKSGDRTFYIEVLDPKGNVLGSQEVKKSEMGKEVTYSKATNFFFENNNLDICDFIAEPSGGFAKGEYLASIYDDNLEYIVSNKFNLK